MSTKDGNSSHHAQRIDNLYSWFGDTQDDNRQAPVDVAWFRQEVATERALLQNEQQHTLEDNQRD